MGYIFRINKNIDTQTTIVDWNSTSNTPYSKGIVDKIKDSTTTQREITSIPSPFARIELVKEAFGKIVPGSLESYTHPEEVRQCLHGSTIYHKMVSDSLDVAQIFFSYPTMEDRIEIKVWNKQECISQLKDSENNTHKIYGETLDMFLQQDALGDDPYNFSKMENIYILKYIGPEQRPMHIIGATSPATLFFSTANNENSISKYLCFGNDYAFDDEYASLDQRDPEFIKYLFALRYSDKNFSKKYPEVKKYLDAVYFVLDNNLKKEINDIENSFNNQVADSKSYLEQNYEPLTISVNANQIFQVEVNGKKMYCKTFNPQGKSDFEIKPTKQLDSKRLPYVLPVVNNSVYENLEYYGCKFGRNFNIPYYDSSNLDSRKLPGINVQYPYLTISDFLEDKIVKLPSKVNSAYFFDGNFKSDKDEGYLLPIKPLYFDYFTVEDLKSDAPSGKKNLEIKTVASGVEVTLRIPIAGGEIEYKRIYTLDVSADQKNNRGAIIVAPEDFVVGIFPPIKFSDIKDSHYRIVLLSDFNLNKECSCICFDINGTYNPDYVVRNVDEDGDIRSKIYIIDEKEFDGAYINILTNQAGREKRATGVMIPIFKRKSGSSNFKFAIDFGTSNTHIEYSTDDESMPMPFEFNTDQPQITLICKPSDVIRNHVRGELIPESIGVEGLNRFPMRTVLCIDKNNAGINESGKGPYMAFGNASPAFMYNKTEVGPKYNEYIPNLKWSKLDNENIERIRCYIESIFYMIRNKVVQEGGSLANTEIRWFYPISMSNNKRGLFEQVWNSAYKTYFNSISKPIAITESIAPYSFFQKTMEDVTNIVTIDIGGGTTDIVVADSNGVQCVTSMRFAADAIFGKSLVSVTNGSLNGIIKQFKDIFLKKLKGLTDLHKMLNNKTLNNMGNSSEVASFLFSLSDNEQVKKKHLEKQLDFNGVLMKDSTQKIVFYIFYTAIMYHLANLMKSKNLPYPVNIAFSGNGSKVISILSPSHQSLVILTSHIFSDIYDCDLKSINLIINSDNPKEATCKGGLFLENRLTTIENTKSVLIGKDNSSLAKDELYADVKKLYSDITKEVIKYSSYILLRLPKSISLNDEFGIDNESIKLAIDCFNKDLNTYLEKGIKLKLDSQDISVEDKIEEPLFFYPVIGVMNDLSEQIYIRNIGILD